MFIQGKINFHSWSVW